MAGFSTIAIIYNPNATGNGRRLGEKLIAKLKTRLPDQKFELVATKGIGHAEALAYSIAKASARPLIISASGDGGYHEVINGVLRAQAEGATPTTGLLPAGNANDHYHGVHAGDIASDIQAGKVRPMDILKLTTKIDGVTHTQFAHSYIGFGINAAVAQNVLPIKGQKFQEFLMTLRTVLTSQPVTFVVERQPAHAHSVIASNVATVGKYFTIASNARPDDGKFELLIFDKQNKLRLSATILKRMMRLRHRAEQATIFSFVTTTPTTLQVDGEIMMLSADTEVQINIEPKILRCIV